ncbi:hypothetical protein MIR68_011235 [Amoeboaphelidium protococcarum]|nr:hypothetical protein MIR68_011235 [Amoeboaphelidium protococcarum]
MEQDMAQSNTCQQYLDVYIRYFEDVYAFYSRSFHRNWRFRRFCATKSAFGKVINMMYGRPKPPVPKINDRRRGKAAKKRKRELRKSNGKFSPPDKPPVIALGDAGVKHVRGNPPVPVRKFAFEFSRRALVVITPEFHTSKQHSLCHADLQWEHEVVMRCRHKKAKKILPGRRRAQTVCIKADGPEILSYECPDRFNRRVQSRFGVCPNCQNTGCDVFVDRDVNAYRSLSNGDHGRMCGLHSTNCGVAVTQGTNLKLRKSSITVPRLVQLEMDMNEDEAMQAGPKKKGRPKKRQMQDKLVQQQVTTFKAFIWKNGVECCFVGFVSKVFQSLYDDALDGRVVLISRVSIGSDNESEERRSREHHGLAMGLIIG